jgi:bifunctional non-homologous end joining protein LigD
MSDEIKVGRRTVKITNPDKVLFPEDGFTKRDLIEYYEGIGDVMLPHVKDRLMTLERFPDGIHGERFYSKNVPKYFPDWIDRKTVGKKGGTTTMVVATEKATLVYLGNQAAITTHTSMHRVDKLGYPDQVMLDLDPSVDDFNEVRRIAKDVKALLEEIGLVPFVKTSGSRGLHVVAPLDGKADVEAVRAFARDVAIVAAKRDPERVTIEGSKADRKDRLYMDWLRNSYGQHAVSPYGVRARPGAPVAMPLDWDEVNDRKLHPQKWSIESGLKRALTEPDPWSGWRKYARGLRGPRETLDRLLEEVGGRD